MDFYLDQYQSQQSADYEDDAPFTFEQRLTMHMAWVHDMETPIIDLDDYNAAFGYDDEWALDMELEVVA